jgi:hypothetical protein
MTLGHIVLLAQFLCHFSWVQVFLYKLEARKNRIGTWRKHQNRSPIYGWMLELLLHKKSGSDVNPSCSDLEKRLIWFWTLISNCAPILHIGLRICEPRFFIIKAKLFSEEGFGIFMEKDLFWSWITEQKVGDHQTHSRTSIECNEFFFIISYLCFSHE